MESPLYLKMRREAEGRHGSSLQGGHHLAGRQPDTSAVGEACRVEGGGAGRSWPEPTFCWQVCVSSQFCLVNLLAVSLTLRNATQPGSGESIVKHLPVQPWIDNITEEMGFEG